jgi:hypothetical protein
MSADINSVSTEEIQKLTAVEYLAEAWNITNINSGKASYFFVSTRIPTVGLALI